MVSFLITVNEVRKDWAATLEAHLWTLIPVQLRLEKTLTGLLQWKAKRLRPAMNDVGSAMSPNPPRISISHRFR